MKLPAEIIEGEGYWVRFVEGAGMTTTTWHLAMAETDDKRLKLHVLDWARFEIGEFSEIIHIPKPERGNK